MGWSSKQSTVNFQSYQQQMFQENYNTLVEHTPGNPPSPLWKESLYCLLVIKGLEVCSKGVLKQS